MSQMRGLFSSNLVVCLRVHCWFSRQQNTSSDAVGHILCVIGHVAEHLPRSSCEGLRGEWPWVIAEVLCLPSSIST